MTQQIAETTEQAQYGEEFTIHHVCGHTVTKRLLEATHFKNKRAAKWLATTKCYECRIAEGNQIAC